MKKYGFNGKVFHEIKNELLVKSAVIFAGVKDMIAIDEHDFRRFVCNYGNGHRRNFSACKSLCEDLGGADLGKDTAVAVIIDLIDLRGARKNDTYMSCRRPLGKDRIFFIERNDFCPEATEHYKEIVGRYIFKKLAVFQNI